MNVHTPSESSTRSIGALEPLSRPALSAMDIGEPIRIVEMPQEEPLPLLEPAEPLPGPERREEEAVPA